ncbi:MAG: class I SAM-dependent methyltransferase [Anaerolineae bacterium]|nr:class I SAM-dependent methyltransferase [Anaerolineae bacterium]
MTTTTLPTAGLLSLYSHIAPHYEAEVAPAFAPLAGDLAQWSARCFSAYLDGTLDDPFALDVSKSPNLTISALDLGCGTGLLARQLAIYCQQVIGVDLSVPMLTAAPADPRLHYLAADLHALPFRSGALRLAVSSFGLNSTTPSRVLRSIARLLRPNGGMLCFQEWGAVDDASQLVDEIVQQFTPTEFSYPDPALQEFFNTDRLWFDRLQDADDYHEALKRAGFALAWVQESAFVSVDLSIEQFIRYKLAWASRGLVIEALPDQRRAELLHDLTTQLTALTDDGITLRWQPLLFRVCAVLG